MPKLKAQQVIQFDVRPPSEAVTHSPLLYIAGDFNGWHTADTAFQLKKDSRGHYILQTTITAGEHNYKIVRGSWETVETNKDGTQRDNRHLTIPTANSEKEQQIEIQIENWADNFAPQMVKSTAASNVLVLDSLFFMPQLKRQRRIWLYLPLDYDKSKRSYPVLYLQDGQNVFDAATAYAGEWGVDEYLNQLAIRQACIVVAIDNGGNQRMQEYNPYTNKQFGKAEGKAYSLFLAKTLKPYIDKHYRTMTGPRFTTIAGSSMGGLISFYTAISYPEVFGNAGVFSPSFWIAPKIFEEAEKRLPHLASSAFYFYGGGKEGDSLIENLTKMQQLFGKQPGLRQKTAVIAAGQHNEKFWQAAFPGFYRWLLKVEAQK